MKNKYSKILHDYGIMVAGSFLYAFAVDAVFVPNRIVMAGFTGLAQTIYALADKLSFQILPVGVLIIILNVPLFIAAEKLQGLKLLISSIFAMTLSSVFIDVLPYVADFKPMKEQMMAAIFGGLLAGISAGMILWVESTTGGVELLGRLLKHKFKHVSIGKLILILDLFVIGFYGIVFWDINTSLYSVIAMYVSSVAMDMLIYGRKTSKVACIICDKGDEMRKNLIELNLGTTEIKATGGYTKNERKVLICAFKPGNIAKLKEAVVKTDPTAFVIVCDAQDVFGQNFEECKLDSL